MRQFLQISPADVNEKIISRKFDIWNINTYHMDHLRVSEVKERIRSDALHDILANLVTKMTRFLQISPFDVNKKNCYQTLLYSGDQYLSCGPS
jgi:hypothetical protein